MDGKGGGEWRRRRRALSDREVQGLSQKTGLSGKRDGKKGTRRKGDGRSSGRWQKGGGSQIKGVGVCVFVSLDYTAPQGNSLH